jgi:hypothetical protein
VIKVRNIVEKVLLLKVKGMDKQMFLKVILKQLFFGFKVSLVSITRRKPHLE